MYVRLKVTDGGSGAENDPLSDIRLTAFVSDVPGYGYGFRHGEHIHHYYDGSW